MNASLTHFIVPIKPGSAISHGAVKLLITDVEETRLVKSEFVLRGDQGSPPQRKPQSPLGACVLSQNLYFVKIPPQGILMAYQLCKALIF